MTGQPPAESLEPHLPDGTAPTRRALLGGSLAAGLAAALAACSGAGDARMPGAGAGTSMSGGSGGAESGGSGGGHDPAWVTAENAKPGTTQWALKESTYAGDTELAGYAAAPSVLPGEDVVLYLTSKLGPVQLTAYRLGDYGGTGAREVWSAPAPIEVTEQPAAQVADDRTVTTRWTPTTTVKTDGWPEGSYLFVLRAQGKARYLPLVIRSADTRGRLVIASSVLTYQAYNQWGGHSLYKGPDGTFATRSHHVSMDRPFDRGGAMELLKFEQPLLPIAERLGLDLAYVTSWDIARRPGLLDGARGLVSVGHDEYWTVEERDAVEKARGAGTNLAFLGANACYWRIRLEDGVTGPARLIAGYKDAALDPVKGPTATALWRQSPEPRPENSLVGMLYECFPGTAPLVVQDPDFFLFEGAGTTAGASYPGLVGTELDRAYPIAGTPETLQVVAHSPVTGPNGPTYGDAVYYADPSGAGVFATGTMMWVTALDGVASGTKLTQASCDLARTVTRNLLRAMAAGPMGQAHPPRPNLAQLHASTSTAHGTGGAVGGQGAVSDGD